MSSASVSPRSMGRSRLVVLGFVVLAGATLVGAGLTIPAARTSSPSEVSGQALAVPAAAAGAPAALVPTGAAVSYADLASRVAPSVVTVRSERLVRPTSGGLGLPNEEFLRRFFGDDTRVAPVRPHREGGLGSGVVVSADGYILTNHHVVAGAERIAVDLADRRTFDAKLVGSDAASDLAVLKIEARELKPLPLGDSNAVRVGDVVLAFGNPLGVGQTVTMGIISGKGRATNLGDGSFEDFLQTDAPINQGNSGGPLVNLKAEVVGINSQIVSPSGGSVGIGFAIPAAMADNVMEQLRHGGRVHRGQLGVSVQTVNSEIAASLGLAQVKGALVSSVSPGSPAQSAGVERGDVILGLNGAEVTDANALRNQIAGTAPGSVVKLSVLRAGRERTLSAKLRELQDSAHAAENGQSAPDEGGKLGLSVRPLTRSEAAELGLGDRRGLLVASVDPEGPAASAGFRSGDVISEVNGKAVSDPAGLATAVRAAGARPSLVLVTRDKESLYLTLQDRG
jgi:serine protease Do